MSNHSFMDYKMPGAIPAEHEVRAQLKLILASEDFPASGRNRRFLAHVVDCSLRGQKASGYEIATKVFGRPASFNATADPIVRIEASKLRRDLEVYYLKSGKHDRVRIAMPKGMYYAVFSFRDELQANGQHEAMPAVAAALLRVAFLGWSGQQAEAHNAWCMLRRQYPDLLLDPSVHASVEKIHGHDEQLRDLLLEGLRRSARLVEFRSAEHAAVACEA